MPVKSRHPKINLLIQSKTFLDSLIYLDLDIRLFKGELDFFHHLQCVLVYIDADWTL